MLRSSRSNVVIPLLVLMSGAALWAGDGASTTATSRPNLSSVRLRGFGMTRDSVCLSLQAAAKALGKDASYDRLYLLSGSAFAPAINTRESCRSWWHVQARLGARNLPAMAESLGLVAEPLPLPDLPEKATDEQRRQWRQAAAGAVRKAIDSGAVVIAEGGWDTVGGWCWAGVITDVADDGTIRGSALDAATGDGKRDVLWKDSAALWAIRIDAKTTPPAEVDRQILAIAIERIRGVGRYAKHDGDCCGLAAMDEWIASMRDTRGFCAECFKRAPVPGVQDAPDNDKRMYQAAKIVARQLREGLTSLPPAAAPELESAAVCYDRIAALLEPGATGKGGFTWDSLSSLDAQRDYARNVLEPVKAQLADAAIHIERALAAAK